MTTDADADTDAEQDWRWSSVLIAAFVSMQLVLPLSYYLGDDRFDERFAWRMFSSVRMTNCNGQAREFLAGGGSRKIVIHHDVQIAWLKLLQRNRDSVVRSFLRRRCEQHSVERAEFRTTCRAPNGERTRHLWRLECGVGEFKRRDRELE